jgi:hypothetical protein
MGGQGMGLYVTRQTLEHDNFEIALGKYQPNEGASFKIVAKSITTIEAGKE